VTDNVTWHRHYRTAYGLAQTLTARRVGVIGADILAAGKQRINGGYYLPVYTAFLHCMTTRYTAHCLHLPLAPILLFRACLHTVSPTTMPSTA